MGILDRVQIISTVSGGSIIGALYASRLRPFEQFEADTKRLLSRGLVWPMIRTLFVTFEGPRMFVAWLSCFIAASIVAAIRCVYLIACFISPKRFRDNFRAPILSSPIRRFASRTTLLQKTLEREIFGNQSLLQLPPEHPELIINATELRTGSAFRFGPTESGSWRWGKLADNRVPIARAVAASAAYPLLLPALELDLILRKGDNQRSQRVQLTDGGVYDNLGLSIFWPGREPDISVNVRDIDIIICCSAGYGLRQDPPSQFFVSRMLGVYTTTFDRTQFASMTRLHELKANGKIRAFALSYLGQRDDRLPSKPPNLIAREEVHTYPTDFFAMSDEWIEKLLMRGEQLTNLLVREYMPDLCMPDSDQKA